MNEKKTLSHIVDLLVAKYDMGREDATTFVRGMFELIEEALVTEKFVKVKGLGTFKLTEVESRESVDVRTGERIEIQGHNKISFIPEASLKELINKPFAHFENVVLNEGTELPDTEVFVENPVEEDASVEEEAAEEDAPAEENIPAAEEETPVEDETPAEEEEEIPVEEKAETPAKEKTPVKEPSKRYQITRLVLTFALLFLVLAFVFLRLTRDRSWDHESAAYAQQMEEAKAAETPADSLTVDSLSAPVDSLALAETTPEEPASQSTPKATPAQDTPKAPAASEASKTEPAKTSEPAPATTRLKTNAAYRIVGTKGVHTLKEGETLRLIAEKYYGNRNLSKYIYEHNKSAIANPDLVPVGTQLNIPELQANE
jgi:nucleoid DNA-binding protein